MNERFLAEQYATHEQQSVAHRFGMWVFLASELLLFSGLFALYAAYRAMYPGDFEAALHTNTLYFGTANTFVLLTSSFTIVLALHAIRGDHPRSAAVWTAVTGLFGLTFLAIKAAEYLVHIHDGALPGPYYHFEKALTFGGNRFYTMYWITTGAHAFHVTGGLCALAWVGTRAVRKHYDSVHHDGFEIATLYWHFVDVMWLFIWPIYYLT